MFVLLSRYLRPPEEVAAVTPEHSAWIARAYAEGRVLVSGRREPPEGGVIVARGDSRADIERWIAGDPFVVGGSVHYEIYEFGATDYPKRSEAFDLFARGHASPPGPVPSAPVTR